MADRTPRAPVSDARLEELRNSCAARLTVCTAPAARSFNGNLVEAIEELQQRRQRDAARADLSGGVEAPVLKPQLSGLGWETRVDGVRMVLITADAADLLHERYGVLAGSLDVIAQGAPDPVEVAKAGLKASDEIRALMPVTPDVVEALRDCLTVIDGLGDEHYEKRTESARAALAAHDAAQAQRDPVQKLVTKSGCPFCNYAGPSVILRRYDSAVVFEPLKPVTPGHVIVVPTKHVEDVADDPIVTAEVMGCVARYIREEVGGACNVITSKGREATQSVFHLHVHIVPRRANDGLHLPWTTQSARDPVQAVLAEVAALVPAYIEGPLPGFGNRHTAANIAAVFIARALRLDREARENGAQPDPVRVVLAEVEAALRAKPAIPPPTGIGQYAPSGAGDWLRERAAAVQAIADLVYEVADKDASVAHTRLAEGRGARGPDE